MLKNRPAWVIFYLRAMNIICIILIDLKSERMMYVKFRLNGLLLLKGPKIQSKIEVMD